MKTETLRYRLLEAQLDLARREERGVILLLTGHAATHKGAVVNRLNHWLENRHTEVHALGPSSEEQSRPDRKSTRLNSSHVRTSYAVFCLKKKTMQTTFGEMLITYTQFSD